MLAEILSHKNIILASGSPRRQRFFELLEIDFTIDVKPVDEVYPNHLKETEITNYLAKLKASVFTQLGNNDILVTSDTIVWHHSEAIGKPQNRNEAIQMLQQLSGDQHTVYTSVCFTTSQTQQVVSDATKVWFKELTLPEIEHYVDTHKPYDKAGSYGIQDWLGYIGIEKIEGCFFNVMGLPTRLVYKTLMEIAKS